MRAVLATLILAMALPVTAAGLAGIGYQSVTAAYSHYHEATMTDWRMSNDAMGPAHIRMGHMMGEPHIPPQADSTPVQPAPMDMGGQHHGMGGQP